MDGWIVGTSRQYDTSSDLQISRPCSIVPLPGDPMTGYSGITDSLDALVSQAPIPAVRVVRKSNLPVETLCQSVPKHQIQG